jgi:hypothetical protein
MSRHTYNTDHICARSVGGSEDSVNKREVDKDWHAALHRVFCNKLPHERVIQLLEWDSPVILHPVVEEVMEFVDEKIRLNAFYNPRAFHRNRMPS